MNEYRVTMVIYVSDPEITTPEAAFERARALVHEPKEGQGPILAFIDERNQPDVVVNNDIVI